jgi:cob(I)alamin adenosyltransferase
MRRTGLVEMKDPVYSCAMNDDGSTSLPGGLRVSKSDARICALGSLDELNAALGLLRAHLAGSHEAVLIQSIQRHVLEIGGEIATGKPQLDESSVASLDREIEQRNTALAPLRDFVLPGGNVASARAHWARTQCRRAEREVVRTQEACPDRGSALALGYLNRLSSLLFALARTLDS